ncbi:hypothetical protein J437_LFUL018240 [Ladona fulva]|uniref:Uncharacterized protein n=1 Tax=Ladona fulva TaxID=123851 RepID=A0A8K0PA52_LADFU|nr:hypothetical protein J437_LFUL018240 [Ladona fulva]
MSDHEQIPHQRQIVHPTSLINNELNCNPEDKVNFAVEFLSKSLANDFPQQPFDESVIIVNNLITDTPGTDPPYTTNTSEIVENLSSQNIHKAPGPVSFSNKILKHLAKFPHFVALLVNPFNA